MAAATALCIGIAAHAATHFTNESLHYVVTYKWGLIHKDAGDATLRLHNSGGNYDIVMTAKTRPWADRFFTVRDTLRARVQRDNFRPLRYEKHTHEGGKYGRNIIDYSYSGRTVTGSCEKFRRKKEGDFLEKFTMQATGSAYDMLTIFYYLRTVDYGALRNNQVLKKTIFSGSKAETVTIKSLGIEKVKLRDNSVHTAYHIRFRFTSGGGKKSSPDMDTWISTDSRHIPLRLEGDLPVGKVKCYLISY